VSAYLAAEGVFLGYAVWRHESVRQGAPAATAAARLA
jgi:hypothetical protein